MLENACQRHPANRVLLTALVTINQNAGNQTALKYAETVLQANHEDKEAADLVRGLKCGQ